MHDFLLKDGVVVNRTSLDGTFIYAFFLATTAFLAGLATLTFPKEPAKIFPFFVLISPRPIINLFLYFLELQRYKKASINRGF